jgi:hypothetical protein
MNHECFIGLLRHSGFSELATLKRLEEHIAENKSYNRYLRDDPLFRNCEELKAKEWTLKQYGDKRINTDLTRFDFCPICGKKIDWKAIREKSEK